MGLSRQRRKQLKDALIDAFPTKSSLEQMLSYELDKNLDEIAGGNNLREIVFNLIKRAESERWVEELISAARRANPGNSKLQAISKSISEFSSRDDVQKDLLKIVSIEVEGLLSRSLHNRIYIFQNIEQNPAQVEFLSNIEVKVGSKPKVHLTDTQVTTVYDQPDIAGRLLILGEPGVGKTTMLLKLAEELVNRAKNDSAHPIPVLFSLSSWKNDSHSIKEWLVDQLKDRYGLPKDIGKQWINNQEIIPLLDGLDELVAERQSKCVIKINDFLHPSNWTNPLVVCSRIQEYQRYQALLQLNNSLELCPFTPEQVYQYLQSTDNLEFWGSISQDADLNQLAKTPLFLNIIVLSAQEISIPKWQQFNSSEERLSYLFNAYISRMFKRSYKDKDKQPKQENTQRWLSWLAQRLIEESATEFLIEKMQPDWLKNKLKKTIYNLVFWGFISSLINGLVWISYGLIFAYPNILTFGLFNGLIVGLLTGLTLEFFLKPLNQLKQHKLGKILFLNYPLKIFSETTINGLIIGFSSGLIYATYGLIVKLLLGLTNIFINVFNWDTFSEILVGLIVGLAYGVIGESIQTIETIKFSLKSFLRGWQQWITFGFFFGQVVVLVLGIISGYQEIWANDLTKSIYEYLTSNLIQKILAGILIGLIVSLIGGFISAINGLEIENKTYPNQGIWRSVTNCFILIFLTSLFGMLIVFIFYLFATNLQFQRILLILHKINSKNLLSSQLLINSLAAGISLGILIGIPRTATLAIKHFILRLILWYSGYIPWNYAKFLNYSNKRLFVQRIGGGYRFIHDLLRQHFAAKSYTQINSTSYSVSQTVREDKFKNTLLVVGILILMGYTSWEFHLREATYSSFVIHGMYYSSKKEYNKAIHDFNQAIKLHPDAKNYYNRAYAYYNKKEYDLAIADYNQAIELDPYYVLAYNNRGLAYYNKKEYDLAIIDYNQAIEFDPKNVQSYNSRGDVYYNKKEYDLAIADYNQAIEFDPKSARAYYSRGNVYYNKKEYDLAIADYNQAIEFDPEYTCAYYYRGLIYKNNGNKNRAVENFKKIRELKNNNDVECKQKAKQQLQELNTK